MSAPPIDLAAERGKRRCSWASCDERPLQGGSRCFIHEDLDIYPEAPEKPAEPPPKASKAAPGAPAQATLRSQLDAAKALLYRRHRKEEQPISTGWPAYDAILEGGLWPGLHIIVAGSGVGKTQLTLQFVTEALANGIPCGVAELELDAEQVIMRLAARTAKLSWSGAYLGKLSPAQTENMARTIDSLEQLPLYLDISDALAAWGADRLDSLAKAMRAKHPTGPGLIVLDFLQLIGPSPDEPRLDVRERIGRASYAAKQVAKRHGLSVVVVSSAARASYQALCPEMRKAGLGVRKGKRHVLDTERWIGLGKESGEIEYSADSLTVIARPTMRAGDGDSEIQALQGREGTRILVGIVPKMRAGSPGWFGLVMEQGQLRALDDRASNSMLGAPDDEVPAAEPTGEGSSGKERVLALVLAAVAAGEPGALDADLKAALGGTKAYREEAFRAAFSDRLISKREVLVCGKMRRFVVPGSAAKERPTV